MLFLSTPFSLFVIFLPVNFYFFWIVCVLLDAGSVLQLTDTGVLAANPKLIFDFCKKNDVYKENNPRDF